MRSTYRTDPAELGRAVADLKAFCERYGLPPEAYYDLNICLEELFSNVIRHASEPGQTGEVEVEIDADHMPVVLVFRDSGQPFDPTRDAPEPDLDAPVSERKVGGLGIHLIKRLAAQVDYRRTGGRNEITITIKNHQEAP